MLQPSPTPLYTAQQVRELDRIAIEEKNIPGIRLMKRAGRATLTALLGKWPTPEKITVYCGSGNNGGDGYIIAGLGLARQVPVEVIQVAPPERLTGDARLAYEFALREGVRITPVERAETPRQGVIVDALLGTGLRGEVRSPYAEVIDAINASGLPVVAVDIPSGLCADTGRVLGRAVCCNLTVTFIGWKRGLYTARGPAFCGTLVLDDLQTPPDIHSQVTPETRLLEWPGLAAALPGRPADAHKGMFGHVMIIGGELGFGGAAIMAAEAALRVGAGLVSVATRPQHIAALNARCPEVMAVGVTSGQELEPLLGRPSVIVIGPGLGTTPWSEQMLQKALATGLPMVLDADALNILSEGRVGRGADFSRAVLTPHPGEAARLIGCDSAQVQGDRFAAILTMCDRFKGTVLLKGAGTLISSHDSGIGLCPYGNPGMAVGGMGDVLSGVIGSLLAQGLPARRAAETGACLHALAADDLTREKGQIGLCATDLLPALRRRRNEWTASTLRDVP